MLYNKFLKTTFGDDAHAIKCVALTPQYENVDLKVIWYYMNYIIMLQFITIQKILLLHW